jgi:demethylmenaquinone methyltransferase/2-methoxy-6-polyprenyl-1,4-benzoquinol methylase
VVKAVYSGLPAGSDSEMQRHQLRKDSDYLVNPNKKRIYNQQLFSIVAKRYDLITAILSWGRDRVWKKKLVSNLPVSLTGTILDLACGTGDITVALAKNYSQCIIVGVDLTHGMLKIARDMCQFKNVYFVMQDMSFIGFKDKSADIVTGGYALRNAPNFDQTLCEIFRVLKPGGKAFFLDFSKSHRSCMQNLGYVILKIWGNIWGILIHKNPDVYGYIAESLRTYPDRRMLKNKVLSHGFTDFHSSTFFLGLIEIFDFKKQTNPCEETLRL